MTRSKLLLIAIIIGGCLIVSLPIISFVISIFCPKEIREYDANYQECEWIDEYVEKGCIHHHIFYLVHQEFNITIMNDPDLCEINNPYHENVTYWCWEIQNRYHAETNQRYKMVCHKVFYDMVGISLYVLLFSILISIMACAFYATFGSCTIKESTNQPSKPPSYRETKKRRRGPIKPPNRTPSECNKQMPVWSV